MTAEEALRAYQTANKQKTVERLRTAMADIEADVAKNGYYSQNRGRIDRAEICRRAEVSQSTLKNPTHADTVAMVRTWLEHLERAAPLAKTGADDVKRDRIAQLVSQMEKIAQAYNRFMIEHERALAEIVQLKTENASLRRHIAELGGAGTNVVRLPTTREA